MGKILHIKAYFINHLYIYMSKNDKSQKISDMIMIIIMII